MMMVGRYLDVRWMNDEWMVFGVCVVIIILDNLLSAIKISGIFPKRGSLPVIYVIALLALTDVLEVGRPREHKRDDE
jgi:hypothetical protein